MFLADAMESFSLVEILILGFIAANAGLAGACLIQQSIKRANSLRDLAD